jgi:TonB family protein
VTVAVATVSSPGSIVSVSSTSLPRLAVALDGADDADVAQARPLVVTGDESSPSSERGQQSDDVDAEQEVVAREPSMLRASTAGGKQGVGRGGARGDGRTGSGGLRGAGSRSRALGDGAGRGVVANPADARRRTYIRGMWGKIEGQWDANRDVPRWAKLAFKQPYTIVSFEVQPSGRVRNVRVTRTSGIPEFDARMRAAVLRAAPFGRLPSELGPLLRHQHPFMVSNPVVRPPHR